MSNSLNDALKRAAQFLQEAKVHVLEILKGHGTIEITVNSDMDRLINKISFLGGTQITSMPTADQFPPVTDFMGEKINRVKEISKEDFSPSDSEREIFTSKVNKLYAEFDTIEPNGILNSYNSAGDQVIVRGVAKLAGLPDFADHPFTLKFIENIGLAIKQKTDDSKQEQLINDELNLQLNHERNGGEQINDNEDDNDDDLTDDDSKQDQLINGNGGGTSQEQQKGFPHIVTKADLKKDKTLADAGVKVGDTIYLPEEPAK